MDKYGKLRKKIDKLIIPIDINPDVILDVIKFEDKKTISPNKIRQEAAQKLSE